MRILCRHGHFAFFPDYAGDVAMFAHYFDLEIVRDSEFYTFPLLKAAPHYSVVGASYLGTTATTTFSGMPWEVMKANGFVYSLANETLVPAASVNISVEPTVIDYYSLAETKLFQPASRHRISGQKILSYDAHFVQDFLQLRISEFQYE